jgi:NAD(P)-dependent dehydrogenase (short-subunit alcohol dehydrogenase family)
LGLRNDLDRDNVLCEAGCAGAACYRSKNPDENWKQYIMTSKKAEPLALIVGGSRGLGLALAEEYLKRGWQVVATEREHSAPLKQLANRSNGRLAIETIDINEQAQIADLRKRLAGQNFDLLFVNAGVANNPEEKIGEVTTEEFIRVMMTNALSPMRVIETFESLVPPSGTIGVMSSGLGSVADNENGSWEVYRASKAALNMLMRSFAARNPGDPRAMVIIAPGWVRTDMGGSSAALSVEESIPGVVDVITTQSAKRGLRYLNYRGETVRW